MKFLLRKNIFSHPGTLLSEGEQNSLDRVELKTDENRQQQQKAKLQQQINENISQAGINTVPNFLI